MAERKENIKRKDKIPTLEEYQNMRAAQVRDSAAASILGQHYPSVPRVPSEHPLSKLAAFFGASDETRFNWFGANPDPYTCIYTSTDKYGDKYARVPGNVTFKKNPGKYGFVGIPMEESKIGDMIQFNINYGQSNEEPTHAAIYTGNSDEGSRLVSYSRGGTGEYTETEAGLKPTMAKNEPIEHVSEQLGTPVAFRYVGTPQKKEEWAKEYSRKYNVKYDPYRNLKMPEYSEKKDAIKVPFIDTASNVNEGRNIKKVFKDRVAFNRMMEENSVQNTAMPQFFSTSSSFDNGGFIEPINTWNKLSMAEKAEIMRIAVDGGVYDLDSIRNGYNEFARGGRIHIKPENRGKFTALKKRTGHSASWFKAHGTPAQKKMAVFALNARKWKH